MNEASNRLLYASGGPTHLGKINQECVGRETSRARAESSTMGRQTINYKTAVQLVLI